MDIQKFISALVGTAGLDLDKFLAGLEIDEKLEYRKIQTTVEYFKKYILKRHGENPSYDGIDKFWKENQVFEELVKIRYLLNSKYDSYEGFKNHLKTENSNQDFNSSLLFELMDELDKYLSDTVKDTSNLTQADMAAMHSIITEPILNEIHKSPENNASLTQRVPENNKTTRQLEQEKTKSLPLNSDFNIETEVDIIKRILQEDFPIGNYKTNLQKFLSDGYKNYYPVKKKEQHFTFDEKFTAIEQHYNGVDKLYAIFEFIIDLYSEMKNKNKFISSYMTSEKFKQQEESGWLPENDDQVEEWRETIKHISLADQCEKLCERLKYSLGKTNHELVELDNGRKSIVEKNRIET